MKGRCRAKRDVLASVGRDAIRIGGSELEVYLSGLATLQARDVPSVCNDDRQSGGGIGCAT